MGEIASETMLGYRVCSETMEACLDDIESSIEQGMERRWLACLNPHSYAVALNNPNFETALKQADWLIPDGSGIVLASRILGGTIRQRVTGPDVFQGLSQRLHQRGGCSVFFLGSTEQTLEAIREKMSRDWPELQVAGTYSPPFKAEFSDDDIDQMVESINAVRPDVLWVGMTAPKQEQWIMRVLPRLEVRFVAAIGAAFDFYTGRIKRSHPVFQRLGVEWLPRLVQEPRRLWRRMFVSAPVFLWHVFRARLTSTGRAAP